MVVLSWTTLVVGLFSFFLGRVSSNLKVRVLYIGTVQYFHYSYTPFSNISGGSTYLSHWIYQSFLTTLFPFFFSLDENNSQSYFIDMSFSS